MPRAGLLALAALPLIASGGAAQHLGFRVDPDVALRIHNLTGLTRVVAWERDSIDLVASIPPGGGRLYGGGAGKGAKLGVEAPGRPDGGGGDLVVRVPAGARVWVKSASARVEVMGVTGEVEVSTVTGPVRLIAEPRVVMIETIDGAVEVQGAATVLRVRSGSGAVTVGGARGDLSVATVGGSITVQGGELRSARLESVSGRVMVQSPVATRGRLEIQTHDGDVVVRLGAVVDARLELESLGGIVATRLAGEPERIHRGPATVTVGKGATAGRGALVTVRSFKGAIRVDSNPGD